jgi:Arc/MetJ-type ribon-helix-helix transcriptional regulator
MKRNTKSSITLPLKELELVEGLIKSLGAKSKVEVIRRGLYLLKSQTDREALRAAYSEASRKARKSIPADLAELDHLSGEGIE